MVAVADVVAENAFDFDTMDLRGVAAPIDCEPVSAVQHYFRY